MMECLEFHHVGIACSNLQSEVEFYQALGFELDGGVFEDPIQLVRGAFLLSKAHRIELLEPMDPVSPAARFVNAPSRIYHQGFLTKNFVESCKAMRGIGAFPLSAPAPAVAFDNRMIAFFMMKNRAIIELIEAG